MKKWRAQKVPDIKPPGEYPALLEAARLNLLTKANHITFLNK
jgi:hypothetical protein